MPTRSLASPLASPVTGKPISRTLVIVLSSVLPVVGVVIGASIVLGCYRYRQRRGGSLFPRGISPIDDEEIETWKGRRPFPKTTEAGKMEKIPFETHAPGDAGSELPAPYRSIVTSGAGTVLQRRGDPPQTPCQIPQGAGADGRQPPLSNVIIYREPPQPCPNPDLPDSASPAAAFPQVPDVAAVPLRAVTGTSAAIWLSQPMPRHRRSEEFAPRPARSLSFGSLTPRGFAGRLSLDQDRGALPPQTPMSPPLAPPPALQLARAPNSRAGLTDETVPGDPSFLPAPKRQRPRLIKMPPAVGGTSELSFAATTETRPETAAGVTTGTAAPAVSRRWKSRSAGSNGPRPNLPKAPSAKDTSSQAHGSSAAHQHSRSRSTRSRSIVSGHSLGNAGSEVTLNQPFELPSRPWNASQAQQQLGHRPEPPPRVPQHTAAVSGLVSYPGPVLPPPARPCTKNSNSNSNRKHAGFCHKGSFEKRVPVCIGQAIG